jgi:hypothetical protein
MTPHEYREALLGLVEHLPEAEQAVVAAVLMGLADDEAAALYTAAKARKAELAAGDVAAALELGRAHGAADTRMRCRARRCRRPKYCRRRPMWTRMPPPRCPMGASVRIESRAALRALGDLAAGARALGGARMEIGSRLPYAYGIETGFTRSGRVARRAGGAWCRRPGRARPW